MIFACVRPFVEVDINPRFKNLNLRIMFIADKTYHIGWDSWVCHSTYEEGFTFWGFAIGRLRWSIWKNHVQNCAPCDLPTCGWPSGSIIGYSSNRFALYVM
jgi:hypothetical protein